MTLPRLPGVGDRRDSAGRSEWVNCVGLTAEMSRVRVCFTLGVGGGNFWFGKMICTLYLLRVGQF